MGRDAEIELHAVDMVDFEFLEDNFELAKRGRHCPQPFAKASEPSPGRVARFGVEVQADQDSVG